MLLKWEQVVCLIFLGIGSASDIKKREVTIIWPAIAVASVMVYRLLEGNLESQEVCLALIPAALLWLLRLISSEQIGFGDVFVVASLGVICYLWRMLRILVFASIAASIVGVVIYIVRKGNKKMTIPFIPFLLLGFLVEVGIEIITF